MTTTWRDTLRAAADLAPEVRSDLERLILLVDGLIADRTDAALLDKVLGDQDPPELEARLDTIGRERARREPAEALDALWATVRGMPELLAELARIRRGGTPRLQRHFSIGEALKHIEEAPSLTNGGELRCPRCRSNLVTFRRESVEDGDQLVEFRCRRCGLYDSVLSDDPKAAEWRRE